MTYNCTCTRCGGTGEGVTAQQAKFSCHHKVGCGRKIGILDWGKAVTTSSVAKEVTASINIDQDAPVATNTEPPKSKKKKKKKVEE